MLGTLLGLAVLTLAPLQREQDGGPGGARLGWRGSSHATDALPDDLPPAARSAVEAWSEWAGANRYRLELDDEGRLLCLSPVEKRELERDLELLARTTRFFDEHLPAPERRATAVAAADSDAPAGGADGDEIPEDPEGREPFPWEVGGTDEAAEARPFTTWGAGHTEPDTETIVFFVLRDEADYGRVLEALAAGWPYLAAWAETARERTGFTLEAPLAGAFVLDAEGQEEFDARNELVNRAAQLLLMRRFGQLPHWIVQGWAWHTEWELRGTIYCFPFRAEFVFATEHEGWDQEMAARMRERGKQALRWEELADWPRGTFRNDEARRARGFVKYACATAEPGALSTALEALRAHYVEHSLRDVGDGERERDTSYVVPIDVQERAFEEHVDPRVLPKMTAWWRKGGRGR